MIDLVKYPVITEKYRLIEKKYTFDVDPRLTKPKLKSFRKFISSKRSCSKYALASS
jgi:ribosomal protein L23